MSLKLGSNGALVKAWQLKMRANYKAYATELDRVTPLLVDSYFGYSDLAVHQEWQRRSNRTVTTEVSDQELALLGLGGAPTEKPPARHLAVVFRGTGGIIGLDYVSRVCQGAADLVEERNPNWAATMGGLPVGTAGGLGDPSMNRAVVDALANGKAEITNALAANPRRKVIIGGYSAGAIVAAKLREWLMQVHPDAYLCSFSLGDPSRPFGGAYYLGSPPAGQGISSYHYGNPTDWRHCWLTHPDDMYANVPLGKTGEIMQDAYDMVTNVETSDLLGTVQKMVPALLEIMSDAGITLPLIGSVAGGLGGGLPGLIPVLLPILGGMLPGLIGGIGTPNSGLTDQAAAVQAAIIALKFLAAGTGPHIRYEFNEVWPGQTYLGLAIQHVRDWAARTPRL